MTDITYPSIVHGLDADVYHSIPGLSNSGLSDFARSPFHYYSLHLDPDRPPREEKDSQLVGTLAHCATLEPTEFDKRYVALPSDAPRKPTAAQWAAKNPSPDSIAAMDWWRKWLDVNEGLQVIDFEQRVAAHAMARSVRSNTQVAELLQRGHAEVSAFWIDPVTGLRCRCRPDWVFDVDDDSVILFDLKTYSDASPDMFKLQIARMGYHRQAAFYSRGYAQASGKKVLAFVFGAVEVPWPHAAAAVMLDEASMEKANADVDALMIKFAKCQQDNVWQGYSNAIELVSLPAWMMTQQPVSPTPQE